MKIYPRPDICQRRCPVLPTVQSLLRDIRNTHKTPRPPPASLLLLAISLGLPGASRQLLHNCPCEPTPFPALIFTHFSIVLTISQFLFPHLSFPGYICVLCCLLCTATNACQEPVFMVHSTPTCCYLCLGLLLKWTLLHKSNQIIPHRITE